MFAGTKNNARPQPAPFGGSVSFSPTSASPFSPSAPPSAPPSIAPAAARLSGLVAAHFEAGRFSDCAFTASPRGSGRVFRLHKFIIVPSSRVLHTMLESGFREASATEPIVLEEVREEVLGAAFGFLYGRAWTRRDVRFAMEIWEFAHRYEIAFLEKEAIAEACALVKPETCFELLAQAASVGDHTLVSAMHTYIADHFSAVREHPLLPTLAYEDLEAVLRQILVHHRGRDARRNHSIGACGVARAPARTGSQLCASDHDQLHCLVAVKRWASGDADRCRQVAPLVDMLDLAHVPAAEIRLMAAETEPASEMNPFSMHASRLLVKAVERIGVSSCKSCFPAPKTNGMVFGGQTSVGIAGALSPSGAAAASGTSASTAPWAAGPAPSPSLSFVAPVAAPLTPLSFTASGAQVLPSFQPTPASSTPPTGTHVVPPLSSSQTS